MYKSPIEIIAEDVQWSFDNEVVKAVQTYNININKEELLRALDYDRKEFERGEW